jgi:hypothetical protein
MRDINYQITIVVLCLSSFYLSCSSEVRVAGELFIVTRGAGNYKLGAVPVRVFLKLEFLNHLESNKTGILAKVTECRRKAYSNGLPNYKVDKCEQGEFVDEVFDEFLAGLKPQASTLTNSDGKFEFKLPGNGDYILIAKAQRSVNNTEEMYFFLKEINSTEVNQYTIISNGDIVPPSSLISMVK